MKKLTAVFLCVALLPGLFIGCGKKDIDTSVVIPTPTPIPVTTPVPTPTPGPNFGITPPEGFEEATVPGTLHYYSHEDGASICLITSDKDPNFGEPDSDAFLGAMAPLYTEQLRDHELTIEVTSSTSASICGFPAYQLELAIKGRDYAFTQLLAFIDADQTYIWVFTGSEEHLEDYRQCVSSIQNFTVA